MQRLFGDTPEARVYVVGRSHDNVGYVNAAWYVYAVGCADEVMHMYADGNVYVSDVENSVHLAVDLRAHDWPLYDGTTGLRVRSRLFSAFKTLQVAPLEDGVITSRIRLW